MLKNGFLLTLLALATAVLIPSKGFAQGELDAPAGMVIFPSFSAHQSSGGLAGDQTLVTTDIRIGYRISTGFFFGMIASKTAGGGSSTVDETAIGNTIGFFAGGVVAMVSGYMYGRLAENTMTAAQTRSEGMGFQGDLGYLFSLGGNHFRIGPIMTVKTMTYRKVEDGQGVITNNVHPQTSVAPYLGLTFTF